MSITQSKASDLRVSLNLLLAEHTYLVAKAGDAAVGGRIPEYTAYATLITKNADDLTSLIRVAAGDSTANRFGETWNRYLGFIAAYTVGAAAHDDAKRAAAASGLSDQFVPELAQLTQQTLGPDTLMATYAAKMVAAEKTMLDDEAASTWTAVFGDIATAAQMASGVGDLIGLGILHAYGDRYPGKATGTAFNLRLALNLDLQRLAYVGTMATGAVVSGRTDEADGAAREIILTAQSMSRDFAASKPEIWNGWTTDMTSYAAKVQIGDLKQSQDRIATDSLALVGLFKDPAYALNDAVTTQLREEVAVVDAQRLKDVNGAATSDRVAATAMKSVADALTQVVVQTDPATYKN